MQSAQGIIDAYNTLQDEAQKKSIVERIKLNDRNEELALYDEESNEIKLNTLKSTISNINLNPLKKPIEMA